MKLKPSTGVSLRNKSEREEVSPATRCLISIIFMFPHEKNPAYIFNKCRTEEVIDTLEQQMADLANNCSKTASIIYQVC